MKLIVDGLNERNFWTHPPSDSVHVLDGAVSSIEGYKLKKDLCTFQKFHSIGRETSDDTIFVEMCRLFKAFDTKK